MILANRINELEESQTLAMSKLTRELKEQGHDIINLTLGEPDFVTPDYIREAAKKAIDDGYTFYPPVAGFADLRKAIVAKFKRENNLDFTTEQIIVSTGAKQSIANVVMCLVNPGDEVIVPTPYWVSYSQIIQVAGGIPVFIDAGVDTDFKITAAQIEKAITPKTKLFIYSSPCNPTGSVYTRNELESFAQVFKKYKHVSILSDEIYEHINFEGKHESIAQFDYLKDQVVIVNGVSKAYAMTGWRLGYIAAPVVLAKACDKIQGQFTSGACSISQKAALAAVSSDAALLEPMQTAFKNRRDIMLKNLGNIEGLKLNNPGGAFYVFPDVSYYFGKSNGEIEIKTAEDLSMYLLKDAKVSSVTGEAFGNPNCIRFSYATSENLLLEACKRISESLGKLKQKLELV